MRKIMSPTEKAIDDAFKARAKKMKPNPSAKDINHVVARLVKDIREARTTRDDARKISLMARTGKLMKRAAYATAIAASIALLAKGSFDLSVASMNFTLKHARRIPAPPTTPAAYRYNPSNRHAVVTTQNARSTDILRIFGLDRRRVSALAYTMAGMVATSVFTDTFLKVTRKLNPFAIRTTWKEIVNNSNETEAVVGLYRHLRPIQKARRAKLRMQKENLKFART